MESQSTAMTLICGSPWRGTSLVASRLIVLALKSLWISKHFMSVVRASYHKLIGSLFCIHVFMCPCPIKSLCITILIGWYSKYSYWSWNKLSSSSSSSSFIHWRPKMIIFLFSKWFDHFSGTLEPMQVAALLFSHCVHHSVNIPIRSLCCCESCILILVQAKWLNANQFKTIACIQWLIFFYC